MVDVSLAGTSVEPDAEDMAACYGQQVTPGDILTGAHKGTHGLSYACMGWAMPALVSNACGAKGRLLVWRVLGSKW
jgi:hypothetical protein